MTKQGILHEEPSPILCWAVLDFCTHRLPGFALSGKVPLVSCYRYTRCQTSGAFFVRKIYAQYLWDFMIRFVGSMSASADVLALASAEFELGAIEVRRLYRDFV